MNQSISQPVRITPQQTEQIIQQLWHSELFAPMYTRFSMVRVTEKSSPC